MNVYHLTQNTIVDGSAFRQIDVTALDEDHAIEVANAESRAKNDASLGWWESPELLNTDSTDKYDAGAVMTSNEG